jgi:hypothetical protein
MTSWDRIQVQRKTLIKKKTEYSASLGLYRTTSTSSVETVSFSDDTKSDGPQAPDRSKKIRMSKRRKQLIEDKLKTMDDIWAPECRPPQLRKRRFLVDMSLDTFMSTHEKFEKAEGRKNQAEEASTRDSTAKKTKYPTASTTIF